MSMSASVHWLRAMRLLVRRHDTVQQGRLRMPRLDLMAEHHLDQARMLTLLCQQVAWDCQYKMRPTRSLARSFGRSQAAYVVREELLGDALERTPRERAAVVVVELEHDRRGSRAESMGC